MDIQVTGDGSHTIVSKIYQEAYHSKHGAVTESKHVFIAHGLIPTLEIEKERPLRLLEIGFGTGLNALLTGLYSIENQVYIQYDTMEAHPLSIMEVVKLNYCDVLQTESCSPLFHAIHEAPWNQRYSINAYFNILKQESTFETLSEKSFYHHIYMDAFAPTAQPQFWELPFVTQLAEALTPGGSISTYCAKGSFKRALKSAGLQVTCFPGPPGKREMTVAIRPQ
jgi:tRNA U34 5-methylaminomethyl-2-thiouridine-forming methyltransferase MnmC